MSTTKLIDNNRRTHAAKVLAQASRKNQTRHEESETSSVNESTSDSLRVLREQYEVIRDDVLKLREDLAEGYDLVLEYFKDHVNLRNLIRIK